MNDLPEVFVLSATRTAIGRYGGGLAGVPPCDLPRQLSGRQCGGPAPSRLISDTRSSVT